MKKIILLLLPISAFAASDEQLPGGSWVNSCLAQTASMDYGVIKATCKVSGGFLSIKSVSFDYKTNCKPGSNLDFKNNEFMCVDVANNNQGFNPNNGGFNPAPVVNNLPQGPWVNYCNVNDASFEKGKLKAVCSSKNGTMSATLAKLDYKTNCKPNALVDYKNGELFCITNDSNGGFNPQPTPVVPDDGLPGGNWRDSCEVKGSSMSFSTLWTKCKGYGDTSYWMKTFDYDKCANDNGINFNRKKGELECAN